MSIRKYWRRFRKSLQGGRPSKRPQGLLARHLFLEQLEDRLAPAVGLTGSDQQLLQAYGQLPLSFEANTGQTDAQVRYLSRGSGYTLFLTSSGAVLDLEKPTGGGADSSSPPTSVGGVALAMKLLGANPQALVVGLEEQSGTSNYFVGNDPRQWQTNVANFSKVAYQDVYRGVNLVYYGNQRQLEYDFVVAPGTDPGIIRFAIQGADGISLDDQGNLVLHTATGDVLEHAPVIYQETGGARQAVAGQFVLLGSQEVGFRVGPYDGSRALVIDPVLFLSYSTYLAGNSNDYGRAIAVDGSGNAYIIGYTTTTNFPTTAGVYQTRNPTLFPGDDRAAFVAKLNANGTALLYSTYLGGSRDNYGSGIAVDGSGNAYVTGSTTSANFPTTAGAFQTSGPGFYNGFVTKLNASGTALLYSTYLGGTCNTYDNGIAVDGAGNAYVTGSTCSSNFTTTVGAFQTRAPGFPNAFVAKLNASGTALLYGTYLGGLGGDYGNGIAVDGAGNAYVTGATQSTNFPTTAGAFQTSFRGTAGNYNGFVTKVNASGTALLYSSYLGGNGFGDYGSGIAVDGAGNAYVIGSTSSANFPTTAGAFQTSYHAAGGNTNAFVTKVNASGTALLYSTYLGGNYDDVGSGIAVDGAGNAYVTGYTLSTNFPTTTGAYQTSGHGPNSANAFVAKLNTNGTALIYSTYLGGNGSDSAYGIAVDGAGNAYVTGIASSTNFPTTTGVYQTGHGAGYYNAFVAKFALPVLTFASASSAAGENISRVNLTVNLSRASSEAVTVDYAATGGAATNGVNYTLSPGTLTFAPGETSKTIPITIIDEDINEPDKTIQVTLSNPRNAALGANTVYTYTILDEPYITLQPRSQTLNSGQNTSFTAASAVATDTVQWYASADGGAHFAPVSDGSLYRGVTTNTLTIIETPSALRNYQYKAVFTNRYGSRASSAATLTLDAITMQPSNQTINIGQNAAFTAASAFPADAVQWYVSTNRGAASCQSATVPPTAAPRRTHSPLSGPRAR
jgi:hypothetical protein